MIEFLPIAKPAALLAMTLALAVIRPSIAGIRISIAGASLIGALIGILTGVIPAVPAVMTMKRLAEPLTTIVSLMTITLVAAHVGLLEKLGRFMVRAAKNSGHRLFDLIFWCGTAVGAFFTNDAAILLLTPIVIITIQRISTPEWSESNRLPFYFAVLYVGNMVGIFVISNPINIIAASFFNISFAEYSSWLFLPALLSMTISWIGLRIAFRHTLPVHFSDVEEPEEENSGSNLVCRTTLLVLVATLAGFLTQHMTGIPIWMIAFSGAVTLLVTLWSRDYPISVIISKIDWQVLIFVSGILLITVGLRNGGFTHLLGDLIRYLSGDSSPLLLLSTSLVSATSSAFINNHSTVGLMIWVVQDMQLDSLMQKLMVFAMLIGGDLGPKMLPIGSLAALMWFRMLHQAGIKVSVMLYIKLGIVITLISTVASTLFLIFEWWLFS